MKRRPEGSHNFEAVKIIKAAYNDEDPYLIFDFSDGRDGSTPFIMKSSNLKVELLRKMDRDGCHPLAKETVHLDVLHSRTKGWKTYTLSYYDAQLRTMVRLAIMETPQESWKGCSCFFKVINDMLKKYAEDTEGLDVSAIMVFNPYHIKDDEHGGNKIGMAKVFGKEFVGTRTSSCFYHLNDSVQKHSKYVEKTKHAEYFSLWNDLKSSVSKNAYFVAHNNLLQLISLQMDKCKKPLGDALKFWHDCRFRWATSFRTALIGIPSSSLAESSQASMKAGSQRNISLVDGIMADIVDSAKLAAVWQHRSTGGRDRGSGPTAMELTEREMQRQMNRTNRFLNEATSIDFSTNHESMDVMNVSETMKTSRSHRPDKQARHIEALISQDIMLSSTPRPAVQKDRLRSLDCDTFQKLLRKSLRESGRMKVSSFSKGVDQVKVDVLHNKTKYEVHIATKFRCNCSMQQQARKSSCVHIIWVLINVFELEETNRIIAQLSVGKSVLDDLLAKIGEDIGDHLREFSQNEEFRFIHENVRSHPRFDDPQIWYLARKLRGQPARCSGCLQKDKIKIDELHLYVNGLLYLEKQDIVKVVQQLRFCVKKSCVKKISSSFHNVQRMADGTQIQKDPMLGELSEDEWTNIHREGFIIEGAHPFNMGCDNDAI